MASDFAAMIERELHFNPFLNDALADLVSLINMNKSISDSCTCTSGLPPDILEIILDFLLYDVETLRRCALVHSSWLTLSRSRLFSTIVIRSGTNVRLMVEQLKAISDTYTREVRVEGMTRFHRYTRSLGDIMSYHHLAELSAMLPAGVPILTVSRSNLFFPETIMRPAEARKELSSLDHEAARLFLYKVQALRFDFADWLLTEDFQLHVADCPNITRLVLYSSCQKDPTMRAPLTFLVPLNPVPNLKHLELLSLGPTFRHAQCANRMKQILDWLVPNTGTSRLQTLTCVLPDVFMTREWETFIGTSGKNLEVIRVSFDFTNNAWMYLNQSPDDWLPGSTKGVWSLPVLREIEIVANEHSTGCVGRMLQALQARQLETIRLRLFFGHDWTSSTRALVERITLALRLFPNLRHVLVQTPVEHTNMKRLFSDEERRGPFSVYFEFRDFQMDPFIEPSLLSGQQENRKMT